MTEAFGGFWQNSRVCAATKAKQSGSRCSAGPSQSAAANWLLWETCTVTHKHSGCRNPHEKHWHTNSGPPSHLLGARTYRCSCFPKSELRRRSGSQQPAVVFDQWRRAAPLLVIVILQTCGSQLMSVQTAVSFVRIPLSLPKDQKSTLHNKRAHHHHHFYGPQKTCISHSLQISSWSERSHCINTVSQIHCVTINPQCSTADIKL